MRTAYILCGVAFCLFLGAPLSRAGLSSCDTSANLVANCGFESAFANWTLSGFDVPDGLGNSYGVEGVDPFDGISPNSGSSQAFFADFVGNDTTLSQTIATVAGDTYMVSWFLAQDTAPSAQGPNEFSASFNGVSLVAESNVPVIGYTLFSYTGTATSTSTVLSFTFGNDSGEFLLDDVNVSTPEPSTWALVLAGGLACILGRKRKSVI